MIPIPFGTDRPQRCFPWMNVALIAANVIIFALSFDFNQRAMPGMAAVSPIRAGWERFMLTPTQPHLYQFITYQFLHGGWGHVGFNMLFLYVFGNNLNEKLGHTGYGLFYLAGGVLAGCGQMLASNNPTLGASGSISAVTGLFLALLPRIHIKLFIWFFVYMDIWEIPSMYFILFKAGQDVFEQALGSNGVAYMAHLSGTAAGFGIGLLLLATKLVQRDHYDILAMLNRQRRRQEYRSIVARGYDPFQGRDGGGTSMAGSKTVNAMSNTDPRIDSLRAEISRLLRVHDTPNATARYLELRGIDATQVLAAQEQVDVASQLMADRQYAAAAAAYEGYLAVYPAGGVGQQDQITLMLGLIYARYAGNPARARELLQKVLPGLHNPKEKEMAEAELRLLDVPPAS
jgi:membrane associated rhomboid family serine protease